MAGQWKSEFMGSFDKYPPPYQLNRDLNCLEKRSSKRSKISFFCKTEAKNSCSMGAFKILGSQQIFALVAAAFDRSTRCGLIFLGPNKQNHLLRSIVLKILSRSLIKHSYFISPIFKPTFFRLGLGNVHVYFVNIRGNYTNNVTSVCALS